MSKAQRLIEELVSESTPIEESDVPELKEFLRPLRGRGAEVIARAMNWDQNDVVSINWFDPMRMKSTSGDLRYRTLGDFVEYLAYGKLEVIRDFKYGDEWYVGKRNIGIPYVWDKYSQNTIYFPRKAISVVTRAFQRYFSKYHGT